MLPQQPTLPSSSDRIHWLRPFEITESPRFLIKISQNESFSRRFEVVSGKCGGPFLALVASLTAYPEKFGRIVKGHKIKDGHMHFNFYASPGNLKAVKIDNRLPTIDKKLIYAQAPREIFWCAFLEKAYATFLGGYNVIQNASPPDVIFHLTGLKSSYSPVKRSSPDGIYLKLSEAMSQESVIIVLTADNKSSTVTGIRQKFARKSLETSIRTNIGVNGNFEEKWLGFQEFCATFDHLYISKPEKRFCRHCQ